MTSHASDTHSRPSEASSNVRKLLDLVGAPADVDLDTVRVKADWSYPEVYYEESDDNPSIKIKVFWFDSIAADFEYEMRSDRLRTPNSDGLFSHTREITNDQAAKFINLIFA